MQNMNASLPKHVTISQNILFQELDNESIALNLNDEHYYSLDETGTRIWQLLAEHGDVEHAVAQMLSEYNVDEASLRQDMAELISRMSAAGMVSVTD